MGVPFAIAIATVLACTGGHDDEDDNQFRTDVVWCEEALARLLACCPGFDPSPVECNYYYSYDRGCGSSETNRVEPAFTEDESRCIRDTPCDALAANGVCGRAQEARPVSTTTRTETTSSGTTPLGGSTTGTVRGPRVCP